MSPKNDTTEQQPESAESGTTLSPLAKEVARATLVSLVSKGVLFAITSVLALIGLLVWQGGMVPAWVLVLAVLLASLPSVVLWRRLSDTRATLRERGQRVEELEPLEVQVQGQAKQITDLQEDAEIAWFAVDSHAAYGEHVRVMLDHLQRVVAGDIPSVSIPQFIDRGVLQPARDMLAEETAADVRLSVLVPEGKTFRMLWAAGHSLEGQKKYRPAIADSLARIALEEGVPQVWDDVCTDQRFKPNPHATRPFRSMVSIPIRAGEDVHAVFNVICERSTPSTPRTSATSPRSAPSWTWR